MTSNSKKVHQSQMEDLAVQIMDEVYGEEDESVHRASMMRLLNSSQISVDSICPKGKTLGFYLAREMSKPALMTYKNLGGDLTKQDDQGNTLMFEALSGFSIFLGNDYDFECVDLLKENGLDVSHTNILGQTPVFGLRNALRAPDVRIVFLSERLTESFAKRLTNYTVLLQWAANQGADLLHKDQNGHQVFDMAYGAEFDVLRHHLDLLRAQTEKDMLLTHVDSPIALSSRKI